MIDFGSSPRVSDQVGAQWMLRTTTPTARVRRVHLMRPSGMALCGSAVSGPFDHTMPQVGNDWCYSCVGNALQRLEEAR